MNWEWLGLPVEYCGLLPGCGCLILCWGCWNPGGMGILGRMSLPGAMPVGRTNLALICGSPTGGGLMPGCCIIPGCGEPCIGVPWGEMWGAPGELDMPGETVLMGRCGIPGLNGFSSWK